MSVTLKSVQQQLMAHREKIPRGRIPGELKHQVKQLTAQHTLEELSKNLRLKYQTLCRWKNENETRIEAQTESLEFITVNPQSEIGMVGFKELINLTVELPTGLRLILSGKTFSDSVEWVMLLQERMKL